MSIPSQAVPAVFSFEAHEVRTFADVQGNPLFCAADVCDVLGYANSRQAVQKSCHSDGVSIRDTIDSMGRTQQVTVITEGNLYRLIVKSRKPEAVRFEKWLMDEVLPTIRQTGQYTAPGYRPEQTRDVHALGLTREQQDTIKAHHKVLVEAAPKEKQAKLAITLWSSVKSKFGVSYKDVPPADFAAVISLMSRVAIEGDWLPAANVQAGGYLLGEREAAALHHTLNQMDLMRSTLKQLEQPLRLLNSSLAGRVYDCWHEVGLSLPSIAKVRQYADHAYLQQCRTIR